MNPRKVNIGLMHNAALAGMEASLCNTLGIKEFEYHDNLIFTSMIQAGVKQFHIIGENSIFESIQFLKDKVEYYSSEKYYSLHEKVKDIIKQNNNTEEEDIILSWFLTDLIHCLNTSTSMVTALPIPKPSRYAGKISLELYALLNSLFRAIESIDLDLPVPQMNIKKEDVEVFREIYFSELFNSYSESHQLLEIIGENTGKASKEIISKGKILYNKYNASLDIKQVAIKIMPSVSTVIESIFGTLPGKLAGSLISVIGESISSEKKITLYDYRSFHMKMLRDYYAAKTGINFFSMTTIKK